MNKMVKSLVALLVCSVFAGSVSADLLIAWDGGVGANSATNAVNVSGTLFADAINDVVTSNAGSTDGTFGSLISGAASGAPTYRVLDQGGKNRLTFEIVNNTGSDLNLETILFDYSAWFSDSPLSVRVQYREGDLAMADFTVITNVTVTGVAGKLADYEDFSISLGGLADTVLAGGQSATFDLVADNANLNNVAGSFDNVAVVGGVVLDSDPALLLAWDGGVLGGAAVQVSGMEGSLLTNNIQAVDLTAGSTDGTFGPSAAGASTSAQSYKVREANGNEAVNLLLTNNTGSDVLLDSIVFDYSRWYTDSPRSIRVSYVSGDLANILPGQIIVEVSTDGELGKIADYDDFSVSLSGLADMVLADSESVEFKLQVFDANNNSTAGAFDNIGFVGSVLSAGGTGFDAFVEQYGLSGNKTAHGDADGLNDWGEYVFGGDPTNSNDIGSQPVFDATTGSYIYSLVGDNMVVAHVVTTSNLLTGIWATNSTVSVTENDGSFYSYTNSISISDPELFVRLLVE